MPACAICGEPLQPGAKLCVVCGTRLADADVPMGVIVSTPAEQTPTKVFKTDLAPGYRQCGVCGKTHPPEYTDAFCDCGAEIFAEPTTTRPPAVKPAPGTPCLVLIGADRAPIQYFALSREATSIGRTDPVAGVFPDIDLAAWVDASALRKISRQHALVLHVRAGDRYTLRPLPGNTGTQLERDMIVPNQDYPLSPGQRFILGGAVRFRFEIA